MSGRDLYRPQPDVPSLGVAMARLPLVIPVWVLVSAAACGSVVACTRSPTPDQTSRTALPPNVVCTLVGCDSGTTVHLAALPSGPFQIAVRFPGVHDVAYIYDCGPNAECRQDVFFPGLVAFRLYVTVTAAGRTRVTEVWQIPYTSSRPNGPHCEPECRRATITAQIPE